MQVRPFTVDDSEQWDKFCADAHNATFLHKRHYLAYHGERFRDCSLIVIDEKGQWLGVMPAAQDPADSRCVVTHPGITYGGMVHAGRLRGACMLEALQQAAAFYSAIGYQRFRYKALPHIYHRIPAQDDLYALFRLGGHRFRCDLSSCIDLQYRTEPSSRRRRALRKAHKAAVSIGEGVAHVRSLWPVLRDNLARKHDATPVHTESEILVLAERFPANIRFIYGWLDGELVAGVVLFVTETVHHAQYIASSERGQEVNALDALFEHYIANAAAEGVRWFDFGISNEQQGQYLNDGLYTFKSEFGGGGAVHEFYELMLGNE